METPVKVSSDDTPKEMWCVMKVHKWNHLQVGGYKVSAKQIGSSGFIPVFDSRELAVAWDDGSDEHVFRLATKL